LTWRDVLVRYKQTAIGVVWVLIQPALTMVIFAFIFGRLAKLPTEGIPYPILVLSALLPWQFFSRALSEGSNSLVGNSALISKIYFPRLIIPIATIAAGLFDFLVSLVLLAIAMLWYHMVPTLAVLWLLVLVPLSALCACGPGVWVAALNVKYRDFRYAIPFIVQMGTYVSPIGFSTDVVPMRWRLLYSLNPMVGVIDGFRYAISGGRTAIYAPGFVLSMAVAFALLAAGTAYFRRTERTFADVI
jgi:lipopolysaccharide transport system permease protein